MIQHSCRVTFSVAWVLLFWIKFVEGGLDLLHHSVIFNPDYSAWCANKPNFLPFQLYDQLPRPVKKLFAENSEIFKGPADGKSAIPNLELYQKTLSRQFPTIPARWRHHSGMMDFNGPTHRPFSRAEPQDYNEDLQSPQLGSYFTDSYKMINFKAKSIRETGEEILPVTLRCLQYKGEALASVPDVIHVVRKMVSWAREKSCVSGVVAQLYHKQGNEVVGNSLCVLTHSSTPEKVVAPKWPAYPRTFLYDHKCNCHDTEKELWAVAKRSSDTLDENLFMEIRNHSLNRISQHLLRGLREIKNTIFNYSLLQKNTSFLT